MTPFTEIGLNPKILKAIGELGFEKPTPIQSETIPHSLTSKQDLIASAQTGTGKTAAFGLPIVNLTDVEDKRTQTIILCPTRELCMQIAKDLSLFSKYIKDLNVVPVFGGERIDIQIKALKKGAHIVVGTPGRTKDLIKRKKLFIDNIKTVILDEADEMLTMGFKDDLESILSNTPDQKQTLLFSATMSPKVINITKKYMRDSLEISVARVDLATKNVDHIFYVVQAKDRYETIKRIADMNPDIYGIVFCRTRNETRDIANKLMQDNYNADTLHGDLTQQQRDEVMGRFRKKQIQILVATDVASRGLDVHDLTHVVNYNLPDDSEVYIHRSGRTGRAGKKGISIAIAHGREVRKIRELESRFKISFSKELVPSGIDICKKRLFSLIDKVEKIEVNNEQIEPFLPSIREKLEHLEREDLIKHFVSAEFNRYLSYYKNSRDINLTGQFSNDKKRGRDSKPFRDRESANFSYINVNLGFKDKLNPGKLIGFINETLKSNEASIGHIEISRNSTFFEIDSQHKDNLLSASKKKKFNGSQIQMDEIQSKPKRRTESKKKFGYRKKKRR